MKITLAQISYHTGNFQHNREQIIQKIHQAKEAGSDLVVFAEMSTCGYPPRDFLEFADFINLAEESVASIASHCVGIAAIIGSPTRNPVIEGKDLFNSAIFMADGEVQQVVNKTLLPTYDIFDEYRYFEPNTVFNLVEFNGFKIALTVCEDLWNINENPMYVTTPMDELMKLGPDFMINIAASPFSKVQIQTRHEVLQANVQRYGIPLFYVNHVGAQTHLIFDGGSCVLDPKQQRVQELNYFEPDLRSFEVVKKESGVEISSENHFSDTFTARNKYEDVEKALVLGIREYFEKLGFKRAILGLSGGIDSALVACLAAKALGSDNVLAVLLPSRFSSDHSVDDSMKLVQTLGIKHHLISIEETFSALEHTLQPYFEGTPFGLTEENMQSRSRAVILMALSNKFGYILLNTTNKSELSVGYGTLYGDMCGGLSVIGDLYKTEVFELCQYLNRTTEIIPNAIIEKEPSAELRPDQKDSDSLPPYPVLDRILLRYIEGFNGPKEMIADGFDETLVKRILRMVNMNEWKRWQAPPVLRISKKAFGPGRRLPIAGKYLG